jgi:GNAT superfamily N-acetyltransferase
MKDKVRIVKTTSENPDFENLIKALDESLWEHYPELKSDYWGNNILELNPNVVILYIEDKAVGCGCFKKYDKNTIEIKRIFVSPEVRGMGLAQTILLELEGWAGDLGYSFSVLEIYTNKKKRLLYIRKQDMT